MSARNFLSTSRKIVAIGRNFGAHAKELGNAVPTSPFFFLKPTSSFLPNGGTVEIPTGCEVHHEVELAVVIGKNGRDFAASKAMDYVGGKDPYGNDKTYASISRNMPNSFGSGYALAIDMTARNLQNEAKKKGLPWSAAKGFDTFTPISDFIAKESIPDTSNVDLWLKVNGAFRQQGNTKDMIFSIPSLLEYVGSIMKLEVGDVILTGTPQGVGPIHAGDVITAGLKPGHATSDLVQVKYSVSDRNGLFKC